MLVQPEPINAWAQAVMQTLQADEHQHGYLMDEQVFIGDLAYESSMPWVPTSLSGLGLKRVPGLLIKWASGERHGQVARQLVAEDEFNHVGLVPKAAQGRVGRAVSA